MLTLHASCVAIAGNAVLLRGPSGAGKSDLALRLIDSGIADDARALLIADDQVVLQRQGSALLASAPPALHGLIEVRGLGPIDIRDMGLMTAPPMPLRLIVDLLPRAEMPRLPEARFETMLGIALPALALDPFAASAAIAVRWALMRAAAGCLFTPAEVVQLQAQSRALGA